MRPFGSFAWLWADASNLVWSAYGVDSSFGRFMDRRVGIPLGRIALAEFEMLGEEQPSGTGGVNRFGDLPVGPLTHRLTSAQHAALGRHVCLALRELARPWPMPKSHRRTRCRSKLRRHFEKLQFLASRCAVREHGDELSHRWYYEPLTAPASVANDNGAAP